MKLDKNSISAKLFRWFYSAKELPTNLCPYFWKLVVAYMLAIPLFVICLPTTILNIDSSYESVGERIGMGLLYWVIIFMLISALSPISLFWVSPKVGTFLWFLIACGFMVWAALLGVGIVYLPTEIRDRLKERKWEKRNEPKKEKRPNIIIEMIKATYHKYCPKIDWN